MLDIKQIVAEPEYVKAKLRMRNIDVSVIDTLALKAKELGSVMFEAQNLQANIGKLSKEISLNRNNKEKVESIKKNINSIKFQLETLKNKQIELEEYVNSIIITLPNLPADDVPYGKDEDGNVILKEHANLGRGLFDNSISHDTIGAKLGLFDLPRAVKLSGSRFVLYRSQGAKLVRALIAFMIDEHEKRGYIEYNIPILVKPEIMYGTGQLPKFEEDLFKLKDRDLYLIPTAEVSLTNVWNNEIVDLSEPIKMTAFSECFRSEVGSGGKDTRGIIRNHQFKKVELVKIVTSEQIELEFNKTVEDAKNILEKLELPFRELLLCSGDIGFSSEKTIDLEVWMPSEFKYREISSVSRFGNFQGRRAKIRYRDSQGKTQYAYTINGSGLAIDRLIAAIIENNYDSKTDSIKVPSVLIPYFGKSQITK